MLRSLATALGLGRSRTAEARAARPAALPAVVAAPSDDLQAQRTAIGIRSVPIDSRRRTKKELADDASLQIPRLEARKPAEHAVALLDWLQRPGGRTGTISAEDLEAIHVDMCNSLEWERVAWIAVGRELRRLIGVRKEYARLGGRRICVYRIPPAATALALKRTDT